MLKPGDIHIKDPDILISLLERRFEPLLIEIIAMIARRWGLTITKGWEPKRHMNDLHGTLPGRAIDLRFWDYGSDQAAYEIAHQVNRMWQYDPKRPEKLVAFVHDSGQGIHFHIQVSENTIRRAI